MGKNDMGAYIHDIRNIYTRTHMRLVGRFLSHGCATLPLPAGVRYIHNIRTYTIYIYCTIYNFVTKVVSLYPPIDDRRS